MKKSKTERSWFDKQGHACPRCIGMLALMKESGKPRYIVVCQSCKWAETLSNHFQATYHEPGTT